MSVVTLVSGILLVGIGFVVLIHKLHDRSVHDALAVVREAHGDLGRAVAPLVGLMVPIVSSIGGGLALLALAVLAHTRI
jgi:hypothetical protein